jgi:hypothetical protein
VGKFPQGNVNAFADFTTPNSKSWAGANTNKPITNIVHNTTDRTIKFSFMNGCLPPSITVSNIGTESAEIEWDDNPDVSSWKIIVSENEITDFQNVMFNTVFSARLKREKLMQAQIKLK